LDLYKHAASPWRLDVARHGNLLRWAAAVHEIGMDVAHAGYHKHGEYLLRNMNLAGFSLREQRRLAFLVRAHRRKYPQEELENIADDDGLTLIRLSVLLRLAVTLHRSRTDDPTPQLKVRVTPKRIALGLSTSWLEAHPLTALDLSQEVDYLKALPVELRIK
jgi:exopolyphosphatase/guanosine-5'-triphosphate,3'-diphosphate pyrophosphatase